MKRGWKKTQQTKERNRKRHKIDSNQHKQSKMKNSIKIELRGKRRQIERCVEKDVIQILWTANQRNRQIKRNFKQKR